MRRPPLDLLRPELVVDGTGVGRPVTDMIRRAGLKCRTVTITAGNVESQVDGGFNVAKGLLVSRLQATLHEGILRIPSALPEARVLVDELQNFQASLRTRDTPVRGP